MLRGEEGGRGQAIRLLPLADGAAGLGAEVAVGVQVVADRQKPFLQVDLALAIKSYRAFRQFGPGVGLWFGRGRRFHGSCRPRRLALDIGHNGSRLLLELVDVETRQIGERPVGELLQIGFIMRQRVALRGLVPDPLLDFPSSPVAAG